ncbi:Selenoprotein O [Myotis davidii]|uniref:Selenoprotein O n=1 Tax=Myotis davidii TaxID=225400 RepID=L5LG74_MYODS|nr:Selenoprotein O [Myotis davidii]
MEEGEEQPAQEVRPAGWAQGPASFAGQEGGLQSDGHTELLVLGGSPQHLNGAGVVPVRASGCLGLKQPPGRGSPTQTRPFPPQTSTDPAGPSGAAEMVPRAPPGEPQNLCSCSQDHVASKVPFCKFHLGDRPIPVTFKRAIAALSFWQKVKLAWGLCFLSDPIRQADGRKVLRSSVREFLCSEAMFHLGVPTTRAGACVTSESTVVRDVFYDGNPKHEPCAVVLRIASTFLRFGSFEIFKAEDEHTGRAGPSVGRNDIRVQMLDYVVSTFYPEIQATHASDSVQRNAAFFREVTRRTARMVAEWQCVGFCHGVLNTDNMSIVGLTIDYGPFGFLDRYDPDHVCNASDTAGRYSFSKQPEVCKWNLQKLAEALVPELPLEQGEAILAEEYDAEFHRHYLSKMRRKLGLVQAEREEDAALVAKLLETMHLTAYRMHVVAITNTFYLLSSFPVGPEAPGLAGFLTALTEQCASLEELRLAFRPQMDPRQLSMMLMLAQSNPQLFALIGTRANVTKELERVEQQARLEQLSPAELLSRNRGRWADWLQEFRTRLEQDREGAADKDAWQAERVRVMHANNPKYVRRVLKLLEAPYHREGEATEVLEATEPEGAGSTAERRLSYSSKPPLWAAELCVT